MNLANLPTAAYELSAYKVSASGLLLSPRAHIAIFSISQVCATMKFLVIISINISIQWQQRRFWYSTRVSQVHLVHQTSHHFNVALRLSHNYWRRGDVLPSERHLSSLLISSFKVQLVWKAPSSLVKTLFLLTRLLAFTDCILLLYSTSPLL